MCVPDIYTKYSKNKTVMITHEKRNATLSLSDFIECIISVECEKKSLTYFGIPLIFKIVPERKPRIIKIAPKNDVTK
jgi:hypothetical protein